MTISFWSVFSAFTWFALASLLLSCLRRREDFLMRYGVLVWSVVVVLSVVRLLVPLDASHMIVLRAYTVLPTLYRVFLYELPIGLRVEQLLVMIWLAGTVLGLLFVLYGLLHDRRLLRRLPMVPASPQVRAAVRACGLREDTVCVTSAPVTPMAFGLLHPAICLPDEVYTDTELRCILRHEAAHISGHDGWLRLGYLLFRCLFWWNPFVHWGQRSVDDILELRCDKAVLEDAGQDERSMYAQSLYQVASRLRQNTRSFLGAGAFAQAGNEGILALRVKQATDAPRPYRGTALAAVGLSLALFVVSYTFIVQPASFPSDMDDGVEIHILTSETSYLKALPSGDYERWCNGEFVEHVTAKMRNDEIYRDLEVVP